MSHRLPKRSFWGVFSVHFWVKVEKWDRRSRLHESIKIMVREGPVVHSFRIDVLGGEQMTRWAALSMILVIWGVPRRFQNEVKIPSHPSPTPPSRMPWEARGALCAACDVFLAFLPTFYEVFRVDPWSI